MLHPPLGLIGGARARLPVSVRARQRERELGCERGCYMGPPCLRDVRERNGRRKRRVG